MANSFNAVKPAAILQQKQSRSSRLRSSLLGRKTSQTPAPLIISLIIHLVAIGILAFYFVPLLRKDGLVLHLSSSAADVSPMETLEIKSEVDELMVAEDTVRPVEISTETTQFETFSLASLATMKGQSQEVAASSSPTSNVSKPVDAGAVEQAVDRVTEALHAQLMLGDLLAVWMIDASESLVDDRQRVAERLTPFFQQVNVEHSSGKIHPLANSLVSFGSKMKEHVAPTQRSEQITSTIEKLPIDRTGKEFVFAAVQKCAEHYRKIARDKQLVLVIWTDESGDDVGELEAAIESCRQHRATVHVVGPSAVLGGRTGYHAFTDVKTSEQYQLPVLRGPDSARVERLELGYWYITRSPVRDGSRRRSLLPTWFGNAELSGMLSGFSPHALTRLTLLSAGSYTILDAPEDQGPFNFQVMQAYTPEYGSLELYDQQFKRYPLRDAVHEAVKFLEGKQVDEPLRMFFIRRTGERQFDFDKLLFPPEQFGSKYRTAIRNSLQQATRTKKIVDEALALVSRKGNIDDPLDSEYREEPSLRWRAWYDLTRGRLLAFHVRLEEYRLALEASVKSGGLRPATNHVVFIASQQTRSSDEFQRRGEEATVLLQRCIDQNQDTPWAYLAAREMAYALGVVAEEIVLTPSPLTPANPAPTLPKF